MTKGSIYSSYKTWSFGTIANPATRESETLGSAGINSRKKSEYRRQNTESFQIQNWISLRQGYGRTSVGRSMFFRSPGLKQFSAI